MSHTTLRIATRKSALAMWQAQYVQDRLLHAHPDVQVELVPMTSRGDVLLDVPLAKVGGKGLFVKELEQAMLDGRADMAVHSMKDVPMAFPPGLGLAVICEREDPRDAWISNTYDSIASLPNNATVGTSSLRRQAQLLARRPDLNIRFLRGNVNTRLAKLDAGEYDGIILAAAGMLRLEMQDRVRAFIEPEDSLPAGGQGAVGIECRSDDTVLKDRLQCLHHRLTTEQVLAERAMNRRLEGGCQVPIAAYALHKDGQLWLRGLVANPDGSETIRDEVFGLPEQAEAMGEQLANRLLDAGAGRILDAVYADQAKP